MPVRKVYTTARHGMYGSVHILAEYVILPLTVLIESNTRHWEEVKALLLVPTARVHAHATGNKEITDVHEPRATPADRQPDSRRAP